MRSILLRSVAIASLGFAVSPAFAQSAGFDWSGLRVGVQGGFGQLSGSATGTASIKNWGSLSATRDFDSGAQGEYGANIGYSFQALNGLVFGLDADINAADRSASSMGLIQLGSCPGQWASCLSVGAVDTSMNWYGTVRGTVGQAIGNLLIYGTGGLAFADVESTISSQAKLLGYTLYNGSQSTSGVRTGWTVGGGAAIAINPRVSVKLEYLHTDLGETTIFSDKAGKFSADVKDQLVVDSVRAGITFKIW